MSYLNLLLTLGLISVAGAVPAADIDSEFTGYASVEFRGFLEDALDNEQKDTYGASSVNLEYYRDWDGGYQRFVATGFARWDSEDSERNHVDIREFYWWKAFDNFEVYAGVRKVFWGVTETVHLVDVINQDDNLENIDGEDKLGQPMVSLLLERDWGTLEVFGLLGFREREFVGKDSRLRPQLPIDESAAEYQSGAGDKHIDLAIRWSHVIGDWDIGISHFSGTARDPQFRATSSSPTELYPYYVQTNQTGLDLQATLGDWLWKLEAISVKNQSEGRNTAAVGGFEYTFVGINEGITDLGILLEYQFDDRRGAAETASQNDIALGARWVLNDIQSTEVLAAMSVDLDNNSRFFSVEATHRLNDQWLLEAEGRWFSNTASDDPLYDFRNDDYIQVELRRYF
ncbi:hypothetical protein R50073_09140 [Maricurvus nonylphenolicus]|uniref:hypothetical protein n=1 Tax=Maricurvus nonylphenolicus TaxID=1008307 RepID=UPI0036F28F00